VADRGPPAYVFGPRGRSRQLKKRDRYSLARLLRIECQDESKVVAVNGHGEVEDRVAARKAGFDAHVLKPVKPVDAVLVQGGRVTELDGCDYLRRRRAEAFRPVEAELPRALSARRSST
jgi:CheY-like chemotaxis protein